MHNWQKKLSEYDLFWPNFFSEPFFLILFHTLHQRCKNVWTHKQRLCKFFPSLGEISSKLYAFLSGKGVMLWFCAVWVRFIAVYLFHILLSLSKEVRLRLLIKGSYFAHSSLILHPVYILRCFVANSLLWQPKQFFR